MSHVRRDVRSVLKALARGGRKKPSPLELVSALAEGSDTIAAQEALQLGLHLTAVLPFHRKDYETTFSDVGHVPVFRSLCKAAGTRLTLPLRTSPAKTAAYSAVGMVIVARADVLIAIWDGQPAQGRGGTCEVIETAVANAVPVIWINAAKDKAPRIILPLKKQRGEETIQHLARRAKPLSRSLLLQVRNSF